MIMPEGWIIDILLKGEYMIIKWYVLDGVVLITFLMHWIYNEA